MRNELAREFHFKKNDTYKSWSEDIFNYSKGAKIFKKILITRVINIFSTGDFNILELNVPPLIFIAT